MKCVDCGCTDQAACSGGCFWAAPNVCSKCLPQNLEASCRDCDNVFEFTIEEPSLITVAQDDEGEQEFTDPENIECPDCGSADLFILQFHRYTVDAACGKCGETIEGGGKAVIVQKVEAIEFKEKEGDVDVDSFRIEDQDLYHRDCYVDQNQITASASENQ